MQDMQPVPAATVALVRQDAQRAGLEVLLLRRNSKLVFHGGHWVFPGGRVDEADYTACDSDLEFPAACQAAVRETREEAGIDLDIDELIHTAHWTTPPRLPRRFCTWFFLYPLRHDVSVQVDNDEILEHRWIAPAQALAQAKASVIELPRPTLVTLGDIAPFQDLDELVAAVTSGNVRVFPENSSYYRPDEMGCPG